MTWHVRLIPGRRNAIRFRRHLRIVLLRRFQCFGASSKTSGRGYRGEIGRYFRRSDSWYQERIKIQAAVGLSGLPWHGSESWKRHGNMSGLSWKWTRQTAEPDGFRRHGANRRMSTMRWKRQNHQGSLFDLPWKEIRHRNGKQGNRRSGWHRRRNDDQNPRRRAFRAGWGGGFIRSFPRTGIRRKPDAR